MAEEKHDMTEAEFYRLQNFGIVLDEHEGAACMGCLCWYEDCACGEIYGDEDR